MSKKLLVFGLGFILGNVYTKASIIFRVALREVQNELKQAKESEETTEKES